MALVPTSKEYEKTPAGTFTARCYQIVTLGTQVHETDKGIKHYPEVRFTWELPDELMEDGRPFSISKDYNFTNFSQGNLYADIKAWKQIDIERDPFNIELLLGDVCNLTISHKVSKKGKTYAKVEAITALKKGENAPPPVNPFVLFNLAEFDQKVFDQLGKFTRQKIAQSPEFLELLDAGKAVHPDNLEQF